MRVLLSTIGSRGDVQPLAALAVALRERGVQVRLCVPPDFRAWLEALGFHVAPVGPELRSTGKARPSGPPPTPEQRRQMIEGTIATQFETIAAAAEACDLIVGATALQVAAPSVAERLRVPYIFAAFCPAVLPSRHHAPPLLPIPGQTPPGAMDDYTPLWDADAQRWNQLWLDPINAHRASLGLDTIQDVRSYVLTRTPWLAADPVLAPWPDSADGSVVQTGAWLLDDDRPLPAEVEAFLAAGAPPVYFGFGSIRAPEGAASTIVAAARAAGRRAVVSRGWAELTLPADATDCLLIDEVNQQALFPRVAAVVHHGGAGTTTAAARAGTPQVVVPQIYDQPYWARRVAEFGIGIAHDGPVPTLATLSHALEGATQDGVRSQATRVRAQISGEGAALAAARLVDHAQRHA